MNKEKFSSFNKISLLKNHLQHQNCEQSLLLFVVPKKIGKQLLQFNFLLKIIKK